MTPKYVTIERAAELTGYSPQAIRDKKHNGVWPEGVWVKAPDNRILINLEEYEKWVEMEEVSKQDQNPRYRPEFTGLWGQCCDYVSILHGGRV